MPIADVLRSIRPYVNSRTIFQTFYPMPIIGFTVGKRNGALAVLLEVQVAALVGAAVCIRLLDSLQPTPWR